jgi:hypothetical protein
MKCTSKVEKHWSIEAAGHPETLESNVRTNKTVYSSSLKNIKT